MAERLSGEDHDAIVKTAYVPGCNKMIKVYHNVYGKSNLNSRNMIYSTFFVPFISKWSFGFFNFPAYCIFYK